MSSVSFAMDRGLQTAQRGREKEVGVVLCPNRPIWMDKPIAASAYFVKGGDFNGRSERQTLSGTTCGQRWMVERSQASSGQWVQFLISDPHWPINWLWGICHEVNPSCCFLIQPRLPGKVLSGSMYVPLYGDGWTYRAISGYQIG